jgi:hypothetical protein
MGVVFFVDNSGRHGWAAELENSTTACWTQHCRTVMIPELRNNRCEKDALSDLDGYENTAKLFAHQKNAKGGLELCPMPELCKIVNLNAGWYVPACGQLIVLLQNAGIVNDSLLKILGNRAMRDGYNLLDGLPYWSSSQFDEDNMCVVAKQSLVCYEKKWESMFYRAIRSF